MKRNYFKPLFFSYLILTTYFIPALTQKLGVDEKIHREGVYQYKMLPEVHFSSPARGVSFEKVILKSWENVKHMWSTSSTWNYPYKALLWMQNKTQAEMVRHSLQSTRDNESCKGGGRQKVGLLPVFHLHNKLSWIRTTGPCVMIASVDAVLIVLLSLMRIVPSSAESLRHAWYINSYSHPELLQYSRTWEWRRQTSSLTE